MQAVHAARRPSLLAHVRRVLAVSARRECPNCGERHIWRSWFETKERCPNCGIRFDRGESDYFLGTYLVNFVFAELACAFVFVIALIASWPTPPWTALLVGTLIVAVVAPIVLYPFTKICWLAVDVIVRPVTQAEREGKGRND